MTERFRKVANAQMKSGGRGIDYDPLRWEMEDVATMNGIYAVMDLVGGTWVAGEVFLDDDGLGFRITGIEKKWVPDGVLRFPTAIIRSVELDGGWVTRRVKVTMRDGSTFRFRCFGAAALVPVIEEVVTTTG